MEQFVSSKATFPGQNRKRVVSGPDFLPRATSKIVLTESPEKIVEPFGIQRHPKPLAVVNVPGHIVLSYRLVNGAINLLNSAHWIYADKWKF